MEKNYTVPANAKITIGSYCGTLLFSVTHIHLCHLYTRKFAAHLALQEFYEEMPELVDKLVEKIQSIKIIDEYEDLTPILNYSIADPIPYLKTLREFVVICRERLFNPEKFSSITSASDDIIDQIDSTLYKLTKLS